MAHYTSISCCSYILGAYKVILKPLLWNWFGCPGTWIDSTCEKFHVAHRYFEILLVICLHFNLYFPRWVLICITTVKFNINLRTLQTVSSRVLKEGRNHCRLGTGHEEGYLGWNMKKSVGFSEGGKERYMLSLLGNYF